MIISLTFLDRAHHDENRKKHNGDHSHRHNKQSSGEGRKQAKKNKEPLEKDINIEIPKPIKLFSFETSFPQLRNEFPMGLNLLKHRYVKIVHKENIDGRDICHLYNAFISKRNKNDYTQISIEYFDEKLIQNPQFSSKLVLDNPQGRNFMLTQDPGVIELSSDDFNVVFNNIERASLSFHKLSLNKKVGYWPVVILNNCSSNVTTKDFFGSQVSDDYDFLKDYIHEPHSEHRDANKSDKHEAQFQKERAEIRDGTLEEELRNMFDEDEEDGANGHDDNTDSLFSDENSVPEASSESIEDVFKEDDGPVMSQGPQFEEEKAPQSGDDNEREIEYYKKMVKGLEENGSVLIWFVGTSHYEM
jgi:hypothetical protein